MPAVVLMLAGCGGGNGGDSTGSSSRHVSGVLVQPESTATSSAQVMRRHGDQVSRVQALAASSCSDVPSGYLPLASASVDFLEGSGKLLATLVTDACGAFQGSVPSATASISATPSGSRPIRQPVSVFENASPTVASVLPGGAQPVISVMQDLGAGKVALTVTDSVTGKPILGLDRSNFSFKVNGGSVASSSLQYGASVAEKASVSIVLDASGSMYSTVGSTGKSKLQLASYAMHGLLDGLSSGGDEAGAIIFDSTTLAISNANLARSIFKWGDSTGAATPYTISDSGMTSSIALLRPVADLYDNKSAIYYTNRNLATADPVHATTGSLRLLGSYQWGGGTAFYNSLSAGLTQLKSGSHARKIVVAMTDGMDTSSSKTKATVIQEANAAGVPLYTIGFGTATAVDEAAMQDLAQQTGGEYKRVEGTDLTGLFQSVQIGIRFQYVSQFASTLTSGATFSATVTAGGDTVTRQLTLR